MADHFLLDWPMPDFVSKIATNVEGNEKALSRAVLAERLDLVYLPHVSVASLRKLERLGYPYAMLQGIHVWRAAAPATHGAVKPQVHWAAAAGAWRGIADDICAATGLTVDSTPNAPGTFLAFGGITLLKRSLEGRKIELTRGAIPEALIDTLHTAFERLACEDADVFVPSGQVEVERLLARLGYIPGESLQPAVLTPLLSHSTAPPIIRSLLTTSDDVDRFGAQSGDMNPLHFDEAFAKAQGFEGRLAHGMIFNNWLTRLLGTEYPGEGTIFIRNSTTYIAPMYPDRAYGVRISTISADAGRGSYRILAQLIDEHGGISTLSYNDVLKRPAQG